MHRDDDNDDDDDDDGDRATIIMTPNTVVPVYA